MGRRILVVDKSKLQAAVEQAEAGGPLDNLSLLFKKVEAIYNGTAGITEPITFSVVGLRVKEFGIVCKTKPGRRGGDGSGLKNWRESNKGTNGEPKPRRRRKIAKSEDACLEEIRKMIKAHDVPRFLPLVDKIAGGNRSAALKLHCLACVSFVTTEVRKCGDLLCPCHPFRPYQDMSDEQIESDNDADVAEDDVVPEEVAV